MGEKSANNLINAIENSKNVSLDKFIFALGIRFIGANAGKVLAKNFDNIGQLMDSSVERLTAIDEIGEKMAMFIVEFFEIQSNRELVEKLLALGVNPISKSNSSQKNIFLNLKVVATGTLEKFKRDDIQKIVEENGGKLSSSVSKKTNFVVAGEAAGSKLDKANQLGVKVISEDDFEKLLALGDTEQVLKYIENI